MTRREKNESQMDLKFLLMCAAGAMSGYLLFQDRSVSFGAIWNHQLCLLLGPFIFGVLYQLEFFVISFWLLVALGGADLVLGFNLSLVGPSCCSGIEVWIFILLAGFLGTLVSLFVPQDRLLFERLNHKN